MLPTVSLGGAPPQAMNPPAATTRHPRVKDMTRGKPQAARRIPGSACVPQAGRERLASPRARTAPRIARRCRADHGRTTSAAGSALHPLRALKEFWKADG